MADSATGGSHIWRITDLWDFGVAADITPPRSDEIVSPRDASWGEPPAG